MVKNNPDQEDDDEVIDNETKDSWFKTVILNKVVSILKFIAMGQHATKFYRNKNSKYSSIIGGLLSLVLYIVFTFLVMH